MPEARKWTGPSKPKSVRDQILDIAKNSGVDDFDAGAAYDEGYDPNEIAREVSRRSLRKFAEANKIDLDVDAAMDDGFDPDVIADELNSRARLKFKQEDIKARLKRAESYRQQAEQIETGRTEEGFFNGVDAFARDALSTGLNAGAGVLDAAGGVQGLVGGGFDNRLRRTAKRLREFSERDVASPEMRRQKQEIQWDVDAAKGGGPGVVDEIIGGAANAAMVFSPESETARSVKAFADRGGASDLIAKGKAQASGLLTNPLAAADFAGTQAAQILLPAKIAKAGTAIAGRLGAGAAGVTRAATMSSVGSGALIQGGSVGGGTYDELVSLPDEVWGGFKEFADRVDKGEDPAAVKEQIANRYGLIAGGIGALSSLLFNGSEALQTTERLMAGAGKEAEKGLLKSAGTALKNTAAESLVSEPGEELTGQAAQNAMIGRIDQSRSLMEGMGETAASAMLGGAAMGGPSAALEAFTGRKAPPVTSPTDAPSVTAAAGPTPSVKPKTPKPSTLSTSILDKVDEVSDRNLAEKKARLDQEFDAVLTASPEAKASVDAWRKENPLGGKDAYFEAMAGKESEIAQAQAQTDPRVQQAQVKAEEATTKLESAQQVATADPKGAPLPGLTPADMRDILQNGTGNLEAQAQAAAETVRTQEQTVAKEQEAGTSSTLQESAAEVLANTQKDSKALLSEMQSAMLAGAMPFDGDKLMEAGVAAGMPADAVSVRVATIQKKLQDKTSREQGESGSQTPGKAPSTATGATPAGEGLPSSTEGEPGNVQQENGGAPPPFVFGNEHEALTARGTAGKYRLAVVPMASLKTSDMDGYPQEVQPRDRTRYGSNETVRRIGRDLKPALLMPTPSVTDGPPVVGPDGVVEGGNGRIMGMRAAAKGQTVGWGQYQAEVLARAQEFGVDPAQLQGVQDPILVRVRDFDVPDRGAFARELNESQTNVMGAAAQGVSDAAKLTPQIMGLLSDEAESLLSPENAQFLQAFIDRVVPESDRPAMRTAEGSPSVQALLRAQAAIFARAYGKGQGKAFANVLARAVEDTNPDGVNILAGMRMAAPLVARLSDMVEKGERGDLDISSDIMAAVDRLNDLRDRGMRLSEYLEVSEADMFGARKESTESVQIMRTISAMSRSARKIGETIKSYALLALETSDPNQEDIFGGAPLSKLDIWNLAAKETNNAAGTETPAEAPALEGGRIEEGGELPPSPPAVDPQGARAETRIGSVGDAILSLLRDGKPLPKDNNALKALVKELDGEAPGVHRMKEAQEDLEAALAVHARAIAGTGLPADEVYRQLLALYESQPLLSIRTSTSLENQAYSTPAPLAYLANLLAGIDQTSTVYEPTAGNGLLLPNVDPSNVTVNELDPKRFARLQAQGFAKARNGDALTAGMDGLVADSSQDAVVTNPPFGPVIVDGENQVQDFDGFKIKQIDHLIAMEALRSMKPDGRATLIIGAASKMKDRAGEVRPSDRIFFNWLYSKYNVVDHFEVDGDLYRRQGAGWPVRIISIHGRVDSKNLSPESGTVPRLSSWEDVHAHVQAVLGSEGFRRIPDSVVGGGGSEQGAPIGGTNQDRTGVQAPKAPRGDAPQVREGNAGDAPGARGTADVVRPGQPAGSPVEDAGRLPTPGAGGLGSVDGGRGAAGAGGGVPGPGPDVRERGGYAGEPVAEGIVAVDPDALQSGYRPSSHETPLDAGINVPTNMAQPMSEFMARLRREVGDIATFVTKELQYNSVEEMEAALMGVQADSVAAWIYQAKKGRATIIADQTGVGKGRQAASIIRWASLNGKMPVFLSVGPKLFTDMHEELVDTGTDFIVPFVMNADAKVYGRDGKSVVFSSPKNRKVLLAGGVEELKAAGMNAVFTTYSQVNTANSQRQFLQAIAPDAVFILDESHKAAGDSSTGNFFQGLLPRAQAVAYLSATWAKRVDNTALYMKTDLGAMGLEPQELQDVMARGGYPLQTIVATALTRAGQMFRRERSFTGISFEKVPLKASRERHAQIADQITEGLRAIMAADRRFHSSFAKSFIRQAKRDAEGGRVVSLLGNDASGGAGHQEFSSVVHNFISQMALGMKADDVVAEAIAVLQKGGAPVITLENTMGSFIEEYAAENGLKVGDALGSFDWRNVLYRALERSRYMMVEDAKGNKTRVSVSLDDVDPETRRAYRDAEALISRLSIDIPVSPIDWMRQKLSDAGYKTAEVTGRGMYVDYSDPKNPKLAPRTDLKADQVARVKEFNTGAIDVMLFNVAGATGISMHADARWTDPKNPRPRTMLIAQPFKDINEFMQALGRINRTGQIAPPSFKLVILDLPMETRPSAVLEKKLKSLNANTTARTDSAARFEAIDIINIYGNEVVAEFLRENPDYEDALGVSAGDEEGPDMDLAQKATGHLATLPVADQEIFWAQVTPKYNALIDYLNEVGQNKLVRRTLDLKAKELSRATIYHGNDGGGAFSEPADYVEAECKVLGKPMSVEEAQRRMDAVLGDQTTQEHRAELLAQAEAAWKSYARTLSEGREVAAQATRKQFKENPPPHIGDTFSIETPNGDVTGIVVDVEAKLDGPGSPFAASKYTIAVATNNPSMRIIRIPLSKFDKVATWADLTHEKALTSDGSATEVRKFVMGNIFGAYTQLKADVDGEIVSITTSAGNVVDALALPKKFNLAKDTLGTVDISGKEALKVLARIERTSEPFLTSKDKTITAQVKGASIILEADKGRRAIMAATKATGADFANGRAVVTPAQFEEIAQKLAFTASKESLEESGLITEGKFDTEGFLRPQEIANITEEHVLSAGKVLAARSYEVDRVLNRLRMWKRDVASLSDMTKELEELAGAIENGAIPMKQVRATLDRLSAKAKRARAGSDLSGLLEVTNFLARATLMKRTEGKLSSQAIPPSFFQDPAFNNLMSKLYPFIPERHQYSREMVAALQHALWIFEERNGSPLNLATPGGRKQFQEFLAGEVTLMASKGSVALALVAGLGVTFAVSPGTAFAVAAVLAARGAMNLGAFVWNKATKWHSPRSRIIGANSIGGAHGWEIAEMLDQVYLRGIEIGAPAQSMLREMQRMAGETGMDQEQIGKLLADFLEKKGALPPELAELGDMAERMNAHFAKRLAAAGSNTLDDYFHRVYDFDGLQALKEDQAAMEEVAMMVTNQIIQNDAVRVQEMAQKTGSTEAEAAYAMALDALQKMYDGSESSKKALARQRGKDREAFIKKLLTRADGTAPRYELYSKVRDMLASKVGKYQAAGTKQRKLRFQLPESVTLSSGEEVQLVDRDFFSVYPKYVEDMSRSLAQKELLDTTKVNSFLNGIGGVDNDERREIHQFIENDLSHHTERSFESETTRTWVTRIKNANSVRYLAMNVWYPLRNITFGSAMALALTGPVPWIYAGIKLGQALVPRLRRAPLDQATVAGAVMQSIVDDHLGSSGRAGRIVTLPMLYSQQSVDVGGFYAGRYFAPKVLKGAVEGDARSQGLLREALGEKAAHEAIDNGALTENDLDRFGLVYRNMISGTGRNFNLPKFMGSEMGKFIAQFSSIPMEQTKLLFDRILGTRDEAAYWGGAVFAGGVLFGVQAISPLIMDWMRGLLGGDDDDENEARKRERKEEWERDWDSGPAVSGKILYMASQQGAFQKFSPIWMAVTPSPSGFKTPIERITVAASGIGPTATSAAGLVGAVGEGLINAQKEDDLDFVEYSAKFAGPIVRNIVNDQQSLLRNLGIKMGKFEAEE